MAKVTKQHRALNQTLASEITTEVLVDALVAIAEGVKVLQSTRLKERTIHLLIADACPTVPGKNSYSPRNIGVREVKAVLEGIANLETHHLKEPEE